jgi:hypothetical protein
MEQELKNALKNVANEYDFSNIVNFKMKNKEQKKTWYIQKKIQIAFAFFLLGGVLFTVSPEVRSMAEKWTTQVFQINITSKDDFKIKDGYVYVDGVKTITEEKYKLALYTPIYTAKGYELEKSHNKDFVLQRFTEDNLGESVTDVNAAMDSVEFKVMEPSFLPVGFTLDRIYVKGEIVHFTYQTESNKDLFISIQGRVDMSRFGALDDAKNIDIGDLGVLGKRPNKYWDYESNKPSVKAEYVISFSDNGVHYELFGTNLTKEELIKVAQSIR